MDKKKNDECDRSIFTLAKPITYVIKIAGHLGENRSDWLDKLEIQIEIDPTSLATSTLTGAIDQAGLIGLLRQLCSLGFPLISVNCIQKQENQ